MATILDRIVADTRAFVATRKAAVSVQTLAQRALFSRPTLRLDEALRREHLAVIAEIKQASPSKGLIRADYNVPEIARQYQEHGADALSVLTEPFYFQGGLDHLATARMAVDLPVLRKDFIIDPYQLYEARAYGADAVLLIAAVLDGPALYDLHQAAHELGLSCLVEVYDRQELDKLDFGQIRVLGVNNRDLRTFKVDIDHALRVFAEAPDTVVRVAESGLRSARELAYLRAHGVDAVLIGETFMRAPNPGKALAALKSETENVISDT